jgi:hypothetical protein
VPLAVDPNAAPECAGENQLNIQEGPQFPGLLTKTGVAIQIGHAYKISGSSTIMLASGVRDDTVTGHLVKDVSPQLQHSVKLSAKCSELCPSDPQRFKTADKRVVQSLEQMLYKDVKNGLAEGSRSFRLGHRKFQLGIYLRNRIHMAISNSKSRAKKVSVGFLVPDLDEEIFGFSMTCHTVMYDLDSGNFSKLDLLLGNRWDVCESSTGITNFVRSVASLVEYRPVLVQQMAAGSLASINPSDEEEDSDN